MCDRMTLDDNQIEHKRGDSVTKQLKPGDRVTVTFDAEVIGIYHDHDGRPVYLVVTGEGLQVHQIWVPRSAGVEAVTQGLSDGLSGREEG